MTIKNIFSSSDLKRTLLFTVVIGFFTLIVLQLFRMQILNQKFYDVKSAENSIKGLVQSPLRGAFLDRNLKVVVGNKPSYTVFITPSNYQRKYDTIIETVLGVDSGYIGKILNLNKKYSKFVPVRIKRDISFDMIAWIEENRDKLPGVNFQVEMEREYPDSIIASHMFGYIKEVSRRQLEEDAYYNMGDFIGNNGVEKTYEKYLRGTKGVKYVLVDSKRKEIGRYKNGELDINSIKGEDLVLTIDAGAQRVAEKAFIGKKGALVAIEPSTGEVLAFVSSPQYDLRHFTTVTPKEIWRQLNTDPDKPLFNRATLSIYPPGSTYKMLGAIAALEEGIITPESRIHCAGGYHFGRFFKCHGGSHGPIDVITSIEKSCNTFYYSLIMKMGLEVWSDYGRRFGFGQKTGLDITEERQGILPNTEWYNKRYGKNGWTKGFIVSLGIGQGELSVTPTQLAQYTALIANNGKSKKPHMVKGYLDSQTKKIVPFKFEDIDTKISQKTFDVVKEGMFKVIHGAGTARSAKLPNVTMAGKTGTSQNPHGKDHAWFVAFAPYENPKIAIAVLVENVGYGGTHAAPIARDVIKEYMKNFPEYNEQNIEKKKNLEGKIVRISNAN